MKMTAGGFLMGKKGLEARMVSPNEAALIFSVSLGTLGNWRSAKRGPRFFKVGHKVLYKLADLEDFFTANPVLTFDCLPRAGNGQP
jgi:hypothetical protein